MALFFWLFCGWLMLLAICIGAAPIVANAAHKKEKERKLAMMKEYPHLAKEIFESIEQQETKHKADMKAFSEGIAGVFEKTGNDMQRAAARRQKTYSRAAGSIVRMGFGLARKLAK